ncbi:MAG: DUF3737 family protein [Bacteroidales bacterium]|nr:DUF3737 family protein [Bacteroidales bacterium]
METIKNQYFEGERPLYCRRDGLRLEGVKIGPGESSLKECADIEAVNCEFAGKYPFWECDGFTIKNCVFREGARAALWYTRGCKMFDTLVEAPKMFRRISDVYLENVRMPMAQETFWDCRNIKLRNVYTADANYIFMHSENVDIDGYELHGNYSFQYVKNAVIRNANLQTKDAFWESENITVYDSVINGEFLAWYSKNLRLVRCHIGGTQPLCYCENLVLEDCTFEPDADLAFEYSSVKATVKGHIVSVKNPRSGFIKAGSIGEVILDKNIKAPGDCKITVE